jgi:hypothetical protein
MIVDEILAVDTWCKGVKKISQSWNVQFKFAPPRMPVTAAHSPVHSNGVRRPDNDNRSAAEEIPGLL